MKRFKTLRASNSIEEPLKRTSNYSWFQTPNYNFRGHTWFQITEGCQPIKPSWLSYKSTITHIDYETIKAKIKSIFSNKVQTLAAFEHEVEIKAEPTFLPKESTSEEDEEYENIDAESVDEPAETLYPQTRKARPPQQYRHQNTRVRPPHQKQSYSHLPTPSNWKENLNFKVSQGKTPVKNGQLTRCNTCQGIKHWAT